MRKYQANQQVVVAGLAAMGVQAHEYAPPQGAFYMYVDFSAHGVTDSLGMCGALLEEARVAMTLTLTLILNPNPTPNPKP